ncbi:MAG: hypothetical protein ACK5QX_10300 [bacterium]
MTADLVGVLTEQAFSYGKFFFNVMNTNSIAFLLLFVINVVSEPLLVMHIWYLKLRESTGILIIKSNWDLN